MMAELYSRNMLRLIIKDDCTRSTYFPAHKTHRDFFVRNFRRKQ